ncbi:hypothetical protein [Acetivibrio cellulolyticus]|uniref:hypothetical protein n=1 Tax=Acetivibrio cellulolyticus TaxID=35830 RepID=UPI0001E2CC39|nr:hypothetical protein [Acetivibrio cellulolyticus]
MKKIGIILASILLVLTINSMYFFFGMTKVSFIEWLVFNACGPTNIAYIVGFVVYMVTKNRTALHVSILPLFFFGGLGIYFFPWSGNNIIAQICHIFMVLNMLWVLVETFSKADFKAATIGLLIGVFVFSPFITFQQTYTISHPEAFKRIQGFSIEDFQNKLNINIE